MVKRPKGDGRCVHCRELLVEKTKDHVFPSSWYPDSTPEKLQRWTVPSCKGCNGEFGEMEKELFVRMAMCIDPRKPAAAGLWSRARQWIGIGVTGLDNEEMRHRRTLKAKILADARPISSEDLDHLLPGLGPHPEAPAGSQLEISIPEDLLSAVAKKIVRGCEFWLADGRIIEPPYEIDVLYARRENLPASVTELISVFGRAHLGPGLQIRRGAAHDELGAAMYEIEAWDTWTFYACILPPDIESNKATNVE